MRSLLLLFIGTLLGVVLIKYVWQQKAQQPQAIAQRIEGRLNAFWLQAETQAAPAIDLISRQQAGFSALHTILGQELALVYKNKRLYYWSDFTFAPRSTTKLAPNEPYSFIEIDQNLYLARNFTISTGGNQWQLYLLKPVKLSTEAKRRWTKSAFNIELLGSNALTLKNTQDPTFLNFFAPNGQHLFGIQPESNYADEQVPATKLLNALHWLLVLWAFLLLRALVNNLTHKGRYSYALPLLAGGLVLLRWAMLQTGIPGSTQSGLLFDPRVYASSSLNPSLGDLCLNILCLALVAAYLLRHYHKLFLVAHIRRWPVPMQWLLNISLAFVSMYAMHLVWMVIESLYHNAQLTLNIANNIEYDALRLIALLIFLTVGYIYFSLSHISFKVLFRLHQKQPLYIFLIFAAGMAAFIVAAYFLNYMVWYTAAIHLAYFILLYYTGLTRHLANIRYNTFMYIFTSAVAIALAGTSAIYFFEKENLISEKERFAQEHLLDRDIVSEYLLSQAANKIQNSPYVKTNINLLFSSRSTLYNRIPQSFLGDHFNKYDIKVYLYGIGSTPLPNNPDSLDLATLQQRYAVPQDSTSFKNLYFREEMDPSPRSHYTLFVPIYQSQGGYKVGHVVLDLRLKRVIPNSIYPNLLEDPRFVVYQVENQFDYALFENQKMLYSTGNFRFNNDLGITDLESLPSQGNGVIIGRVHYWTKPGANGRKIVLSSTLNPLWHVVSNFSQLFLLLMFSVVLALIVYAVRFRLRNDTIVYATKIQLYLSLAFFVPLLVLSIITISLIANSYKDDITQRYFEAAENLSYTLGSVYASGFNNTKEEVLHATLEEQARYVQGDIHLYNNKGYLLTSSQSPLFENDILSANMHPNAYAGIIDNQNSRLLSNERLGTLDYKAVYLPVNSATTGQRLGVVCLSFFQSQQELSNRIIEVWTSVMNIFTLIFIVFLVISFAASRVLTYPLRFITQSIKRITLAEQNERLDWAAKDEIGLMVTEYNNMLSKLEASKEALAKSEKESAWREMARQVAHEIKNPLTPMKLTLQHLQRVATGQDADNRANKAIGTLLTQIDTLSDIATSFSAFAKMPIPKSERFELTGVLRTSARLHKADKSVKVNLSITAEPCYVNGDAALLGRIISNLIINGVQSVPEERTPCIDIEQQLLPDQKVQVTVADNGQGISADIREKVFLPNFSTKYTGSGLGLAIAKRGIEHAGGSIWFETEEGQGTTFFIVLPTLA